MTGSRTVAEDLTKDVFMRMLKYRATFRDDGRFETWMYRIARNARADYLRTRDEALGAVSEAVGVESQDPGPALQGEVPYNVQFDLSLRVPDGTRLTLCTINGESITVRRISGDFDIDNVNGRVEMTDVRGSGEAETVNGRVDARFLDVPTHASVFKTINGDVSVTWPTPCRQTCG
jgi:RNA polymerase sigma factor (sigma-70 family)